MGIIGYIPAHIPWLTLKNVTSSKAKGYIGINDSFVKIHKNKKYLFIPLESMVYLKKSKIPKNDYDSQGRKMIYIPFKKIKHGISYDCFEFDFTKLKPKKFCFEFDHYYDIRNLFDDRELLYYKQPLFKYYNEEYQHVSINGKSTKIPKTELHLVSTVNTIEKKDETTEVSIHGLVKEPNKSLSCAMPH